MAEPLFSEGARLMNVRGVQLGIGDVQRSVRTLIKYADQEQAEHLQVLADRLAEAADLAASL